MTDPFNKSSPGPPIGLPDDPAASMRPSSVPANLAHLSLQLNSTVVPPSIRLNTRVINIERGAPFSIKQLIGRGGFANVYHARQVSLRRSIAIKVPRKSGPELRSPTSGHATSASESQAVFSREALVAAHLDHPNIAPIYDLRFRTDGEPMLAMKLLEGKPWNDLLYDDRFLPISERLARHLPILQITARAVAFAHSRGVIHRDLKPAQVIVGEFGQAYLTDWGLAVALPGFRTATGQPLREIATPIGEAPNPAGTAAYMAPEQTLSTPLELGTWTDVYLLGGILYQILTGSSPHANLVARLAFLHAQNSEVEPPELRSPGCGAPPDLTSLCMRAMEREIAKRIQTPDEFLKSLEDYLSGRDARTRSLSLTEEAAAALERPGTGYENFEQADRLASLASALWTENSRARDIREQALREFAAAALERNDLQLAAFQAERLVDPGIRLPLQTRIHQAISKAKRANRQRRAAIVASLVLVAGVVFLGLFYGREAATAKANERVYIANAEINKKRKTETEEQAQREKEQAQLSEEIAGLRDAVSDFLATSDLAKLEPTDVDVLGDWSYLLLNAADPKLHDTIGSKISDIRVRRQRLDSKQVPLEPEPFEVSEYAGALLLAQNTTESMEKAIKEYSTAAELAPSQYLPLKNRAIALTRLGRYKEALRDLDQAQRRIGFGLALVSEDFFRDVENKVRLVTRESVALGPQDIVVESCDPKEESAVTTGSGYEESGSWTSSDAINITFRSAAPGCSSPKSRVGRMFNFCEPFKPDSTTTPAIARFFLPKANVNREFYVYITWPNEANAAPVYVAVHHANGITSHALYLDGFGLFGPPSANRWIALGKFQFGPNRGQYVEISAGDEVRPLALSKKGKVAVDAVLFSKAYIPDTDYTLSELPDYYNLPQAEPIPAGAPLGSVYIYDRKKPVEVAWSDKYETAQNLAQDPKTSRPLLLFFYHPVGSKIRNPLAQRRDYCDNRLFQQPAIANLLNAKYYSVRRELMVPEDKLAKELGVETLGTCIVLISKEGAVKDRIQITDMPISGFELMRRLRKAI